MESLLGFEGEVFIPLDAACADLHTTAAVCLGDRSPLEVGVFTGAAAWVEFRCADAVRIAACHAASFFTDYTEMCCCHTFGIYCPH